MTETSKGRRLTGKLAILSAAAIALPLTATVVPVFAEDEPVAADADKKVEVKKHKVVIVKNEDGKPVVIDTKGDADAPFVKTIEKDGRTIVLRTNKELSEADVEKMVAEAEKSRKEAEAAFGEAAIARREAEAAREGAEVARAQAEAHSAHAITVIRNMDVSSYIPEIDIKEIRGNCTEGQPVSTDVQGFDGKSMSRVKIVMCGKGQAKIARIEAVKGLKEALKEIRGEDDMPESIRKDVVQKLQLRIKSLEKQIKADASESGGA